MCTDRERRSGQLRRVRHAVPAGQVCSAGTCAPCRARPGSPTAAASARTRSPSTTELRRVRQGVPGRLGLLDSGSCAFGCPAGPHQLQRHLRQPPHRQRQLRRVRHGLPGGRRLLGGRVRAELPGAALTDCSGICTTSQNDNANCGACGNACAAGHVCSGGACASRARRGSPSCSGDLRQPRDRQRATAARAAPRARRATSAPRARARSPARRGSPSAAAPASTLQHRQRQLRRVRHRVPGGRRLLGGHLRAHLPGAASPTAAARARTSRPTTRTAARAAPRARRARSAPAGACALTCQAGLTDCSGTCVDLQTDNANCGDVRQGVPGGRRLLGGRVRRHVPGGPHRLRRDLRQHCRPTTPTAAPAAPPARAGDVCSGGACALTCQAGLTDCSGDVRRTCRPTTTTAAPAARCARRARSARRARARSRCQAGLTDCGGVCVNLRPTTQNCGACGDGCPAGDVCSAGTCALTCQAGPHATAAASA